MKLVPFILFALFAVVGCASRYNVYVESQSAVPLAKTSFKVIPGGEDSGLRFQKFADIATKALVKTGTFVESDKPDVLVKLSYSISNPITKTDIEKNLITGEYEADSTSLYTRKIVLRAYKQGQEMWFTEIVSTGAGGNITDAFPYLISAGIPFFGTTQGRTFKEVPKTPEALTYLRKPASN